MLIKEYRKIFIGLWLIFIAISGFSILIKTALLYITGGLFIFQALFLDGFYLKNPKLFKEKVVTTNTDTEPAHPADKPIIDKKSFLRIFKKEKTSVANIPETQITKSLDEEVTVVKKVQKETKPIEYEKSLRESTLKEKTLPGNEKTKKDFKTYINPNSDSAVINDDFLKRISDK